MPATVRAIFSFFFLLFFSLLGPLTHHHHHPLHLIDYGQEKRIEVNNLSEAEVNKQLEHLVKIGETLPRSTESSKSA